MLWFIVVTLSVLALCPVAASGREVPGKGLMTNVALMEKTTSAAVDSLVQLLPFPLRGPVLLGATIPHDAAWMVENFLGGRLREKGVKVVVSAVPPAPAVPDTSEADTTVVSDSLRVSAAPESEQGMLNLEYRVTELGMEYPRAWRPHHFGQKRVERVAIVSLYGRLIDQNSGTLVWAGEGRATQRDVVPASKLPLLEGKGPDWQKGTLPAGKLGAIVEPFVVAAIVVGLVYLFYSNKD